MAKDKETALATVEPAGALAPLPSFISEFEGAGAENIGTVKPAVLKICQGQSKERKKNEDKYIPGLEEPNMFNSRTGEIYGDGPLKIVVIKSLGERAMEFRSFEEGGGIIDRNVPVTKRADGKYVDPRLNWDDTKTGKAAQPKATLFRDYLVLLVEGGEVVPELLVLSMKGASIKASDSLDGLLKSQLKRNGRLILKPPTFARLISLSSTQDKKDGNTFSVFRVAQAGTVDDNLGNFAAGLYKEYTTKVVEVEVDEEGGDTEAGSGDGIPF